MSANAAHGVPVVLPLVDVSIDESGFASLSVDNAPYNEAGQVDRDAVEHVVHEVAAKLGPVRVRVTESDGSEFTDVVLPESADGAKGTPTESGSGLSGNGFLPAEEVDVAVIIAHRRAGADGRIFLRLPAAVVAERTTTVAFLGRVSGTFTIGESS